MNEINKKEFEITVRVTVSIAEASKILEQNGYNEKNSFIMEDIYLIPKEFSDIDKYDERELLNMSVRLRDIVFKSEKQFSNKVRREIVRKYKNFDENNNIINEAIYVCKIKDINEAYNLFKSLDYVELLRISQKAKTFNQGDYEITLSDINGRIYVEMENTDNKGNILYDSSEPLIELIKQYNLPYIEGDYFVQKAVDEIREMKQNKIE